MNSPTGESVGRWVQEYSARTVARVDAVQAQDGKRHHGCRVRREVWARVAHAGVSANVSAGVSIVAVVAILATAVGVDAVLEAVAREQHLGVLAVQKGLGVIVDALEQRLPRLLNGVHAAAELHGGVEFAALCLLTLATASCRTQASDTSVQGVRLESSIRADLGRVNPWRPHEGTRSNVPDNSGEHLWRSLRCLWRERNVRPIRRLLQPVRRDTSIVAVC